MTEMRDITTRHGEPFHYSHRSFFVGLFILFPVIVIISFIAYQLVKVGYLEEWVRFEVRYNDVYSLQEAADVTFRGVCIGKIENIRLSDHGFVSVSIKIRQKYYTLVRKGCRAQLIQKNFPIGDWQIRLVKDANALHQLSDGEVIPSQNPVSLDTLLARLEVVLSTIDMVTTRIQSGEGLLGQLLTDESMLVDMGDVRVRAITLLDRVDALLKKADTTVGYADVMIDHMDQFGRHGTITVDSLKDVGEEAAQFIIKIDHLTSNMDKLTDSLQELPPEIQEVIEGMKRDLDEAEILLKGMQHHWLLKNAVRKARDNEPVPSDKAETQSGNNE